MLKYTYEQDRMVLYVYEDDSMVLKVDIAVVPLSPQDLDKLIKFLRKARRKEIWSNIFR